MHPWFDSKEFRGIGRGSSNWLVVLYLSSLSTSLVLENREGSGKAGLDEQACLTYICNKYCNPISWLYSSPTR